MSRRAIFVHASLVVFLCLWAGFVYFQHSKLQEYTDYDYGLTNSVSESGMPLRLKFTNTSKLQLEDLDWFLHVSDIHINQYGNKSKDLFIRFLDEIVSSVNPRFVACTGDLTDAKNPHTLRTYQHLDEWKFYQDSLKNRQYDRKDFWLDIPGNHDRFDILGFSKEIPFSTHIEALNGTDLTNLWNGYQDYYKLYSVQKSENFMYTFKSKHGDISVFSLDGCPYPGLGRPFNFFGHVGRIQLESLQEQLSKVSSPPSRRIILSHYPINTMLFSQSSGSHDTHSTYRNFAHLSQKVSIYLSGHLHNLASNIGEHLYAIRKPFSLLDLEVGDLKDNGMFRLGVFDDELNPGNNFSFSDYSLLRKSSGRGEIILSKNNDITSDDSIFAHVLHPKDGRFLREGPQDFIFNNEFQILLFGKDSKKITSLKVYLNGARVVNELIKKLDDQLSLHKFTFLFEALPRNISYILRVDLESSDSSLLYRHEHTFRLDGQAVPMTEIGSFFMTFRFQLFFRILFWISFALLFIGALIIPKIIKLSSAEYSLSRTGLFANLKSIKHRSISSMILLNEENLFFFPWLLYLLYLPVGPLFSGHLITFDTSQVFHFFLIGIQVINEGSFTKTDRTQWLPLLDTWEFTSFFLLSFVLPAWSLLLGRVFVLSSTTGKNVQFQTSAKRKSSRLKSMSSLSEEEPPSHGNFRFAIRFILYYGFHLVIAFWWLIHGCLLCLLGVSYGILPFLFSPGLLWFYLYNLALYYWILPRRILSHEL